jgi:hypothetical protein
MQQPFHRTCTEQHIDFDRVVFDTECLVEFDAPSMLLGRRSAVKAL